MDGEKEREKRIDSEVEKKTEFLPYMMVIEYTVRIPIVDTASNA